MNPLTPEQLATIPGQPDGIDDDSRDLPDPHRAAERIGEYISEFGDGLYDVAGGKPLYGRDMEVVRRALAAVEQDRDKLSEELAKATDEIEQLTQHSKTLNAIGFAAAIAVGDVPPGIDQILADPIDQIERLLALVNPAWVVSENVSRAHVHLAKTAAALAAERNGGGEQ